MHTKKMTSRTKVKRATRARKDRQQSTRVQDVGVALRVGFVEQARASKPGAYSTVQV